MKATQPPAPTHPTRPTRYQRWWRRFLWHRRIWAALLAAVAVFCALQVLRPPAPRNVVVLTATHTLPAGTPLTAADVTAVAFPPHLVPEGALTRSTDVDGRSPAAGIAQGQVLTRAGLAVEGWERTGSGRSAVAVHFNDADLADLLRPGQRIRLLAVDPHTPTAAEVLVDSAVVLAVPAHPRTTSGSSSGRLVVLDVPTNVVAVVTSGAVSRYLTVAWGH